MEFQLTAANAHGQILVQWRTEGNKLQLLAVTEQPLGRLVKALRDMV